MENYIPLTACIAGHIYKIHSRNLIIGVYDGKEGFIGIREKFGQEYLFTEYHHDQGAPYGTVFPEKEIGTLPEGYGLDDKQVHAGGDSWARREPDGPYLPVIRRDKLPDEAPHGGRKGFVDLWADTGERLPDNKYPCILGNEPLFKFLKQLEQTKAE